MSEEYKLRAMGTNYKVGHCWDDLDKSTVLNAANEIEDLKIEVNALDNFCSNSLQRHLEDVNRLEAEVDRLKLNASRYEWIRSQGTSWVDLESTLFERVNDEYNPPYMALKFGQELDSAIDAKMKRANEDE